MNVDHYLEWIGFGGTARPDLTTLRELHRLHLTAVPFENLHVTQGIHLPVDEAWAYDKIVEQGRGGWCFELNAGFGALLRAIGFDVTYLGSAVLLSGPSRVIEHLMLEVSAGGDTPLVPHLADVGFGDSFLDPLALNVAGPQDGGNGTYQLLASPEGTTLTRHDPDGVPSPLYRFKRVAHTLDQFVAVSDSMQVDPDKSWMSKPFATRLLDGGPDRVTLTHDRLKIVRDGHTEERSIPPQDWDTTLHQWFGYGVTP